MKTAPRPRLAVTLGDGAGIGPELTLAALADPALADRCQLIVYGNARLLQRVAEATAYAFPLASAILPYDPARPPASLPAGPHVVLDFPFPAAGALTPGAVQAACGAQAHSWIQSAVRDIQRGLADALVTAPINKEAIHLAGVDFPGHTELLAALTGAPAAPCMAFHSERLFVSLATIHEPLSRVPSLLRAPSILRSITLTHAAAERLLRRPPRLAVLALNPHAGENGLFGDEEQSAIRPAIELARARGVCVEGPLVPDTAFTWLASSGPAPYDAYVAMYHDQGLIPFKAIAFDTGVNLTLGLPIIRTSPDHGTAFDIAWRGVASPRSLFCAIDLAARLAAHT